MKIAGSGSSMMAASLIQHTGPAQLACHGLRHRVGSAPGLEILRGIDLVANSGELIGICGPNGAGKSTLLRHLGGLLAPTAGNVVLNGQSIQAIHPRHLARQISFLHQDTTLPFAFPVPEVVLMGRHPWQSSFSAWSEYDRTIVEAALAAADCSREAGKFVTALSGGERQRVMIARVLAQDTPVVLLDEPTASLDVRHTVKILQLARSLAQAGKLVIMVLHDLRAAARYCSRLCLMFEGQIIADGEPTEVLHEGHIAYAYGITARTFRNPVDQWDYYTLD